MKTRLQRRFEGPHGLWWTAGATVLLSVLASAVYAGLEATLPAVADAVTSTTAIGIGLLAAVIIALAIALSARQRASEIERKVSALTARLEEVDVDPAPLLGPLDNVIRVGLESGWEVCEVYQYNNGLMLDKDGKRISYKHLDDAGNRTRAIGELRSGHAFERARTN